MLTAVSRLSVALSLPLIGLLFTLGTSWLESKFEVVNKRVDVVEKVSTSASEQATKINDRLTTVETKQVTESAASDKFQNATLTRLDRLQDSIVGLSNAVAALTATVQALADDRSRSPPMR
ncbi:hypothetical protein D3Y55_26970 [Mesorhizobium sp. DCY119]|nr:hypothetical protein D3Y55_26970 [Mesorhizobium sp. DCY119]